LSCAPITESSATRSPESAVSYTDGACAPTAGDALADPAAGAS
jgi:hypothetical protein